MPIQYKNVMRRIFPTAHRVLLDRLIADHARYITGDVLVLGAGMTDYREVFQNAKSVVNTDVGVFGPHIDMCLDAHSLPLESDRYDYVVAIEVFEHLHNPKQACDEIYRVLKKGGVFLITIPFLFRIHGDPSDYTRFTEYGLATMLSRFANTELSSYGGRVSVISDLITTTSKVLFLLRFLNLFFHLAPRSGSNDAPSGYVAFALK
jgi:SAM-dependent methyltransferase